MKVWTLIIISLIAAGCKKENKNDCRSCVRVEIKDKHTDEYLPYFSYEINSLGIGGLNDHLVTSGKITDGFVSFNYTPENYRYNELSVESDSLKGYFFDHYNSGAITEDKRDFVFYFVTNEKLKIVASNTNCLNANDKLHVQIKNSDSPYADKEYVTRIGCLSNTLIFEESMAAANYEITWTVTRDSIVTTGSTFVELGQTEDQVVTIDY